MHARIASDASYLRIEPVSSREQYRWMERFIPNYGVVIIILSLLTKFLFYRLTHKSLKYARWDGSAWAVETVEAGDPLRYVSLALDAAGITVNKNTIPFDASSSPWRRSSTCTAAGVSAEAPSSWPPP